MYVASVYFKCFSYFQTDVATVLSRCCKVDLDVPYVIMASHVCCKFMLQMFHLFSNACCNCFFSGCCKTSSGGCKSTSAFQIPTCTCKIERAEPHARVERSGLDGPTGPARACNRAGRAVHETEWGGVDLPRV
jgi:hypothetical protein